MSKMKTANELRKSILELRKIYSNLSDAQYIKWYSKHFKVPQATVRQVLGVTEDE